ncbi:MAG: hypothetical protein KJ697_02510 [Nanoarchaeota archaeon]|nr:hypothetical protein [Nanoarchaeota archaeon]MBU4124408.1 hypothetical protein [Nanoarchaeota archaeon]
MFSAAQIKKAESCKVTKEDESPSKIYFKVIFTDSKGEHEHQVLFNKVTKEIACDCSWCSYYGLKKTSKGKRCYNCLAVMKKLGIEK